MPMIPYEKLQEIDRWLINIARTAHYCKVGHRKINYKRTDDAKEFIQRCRYQGLNISVVDSFLRVYFASAKQYEKYQYYIEDLGVDTLIKEQKENATR